MKEYYFISDLHIWGDYMFQKCEFEEELINFLKKFEGKNKNTELIMVWDIFWLREIITKDWPDKLKKIITDNIKIFEQFKITWEKITIILLPWNHDYELVLFPEMEKLLKQYNIILEKKVYIIKSIWNKKIRIEHWNQFDSFSYIKDFGKNNYFPPGYFISRNLVMEMGQISMNKKQKWLWELKYTDVDRTFSRAISNYFYRELNPFIRYSLVPFLLLFSFSFIVLIGLLLEKFAIIKTNYLADLWHFFWIFWNVLDLVIWVDIFFIVILAIFFIPYKLLLKDFKKFLRRYWFTKSILKIDELEKYKDSILNIFYKHPKVSIFIFGHTHRVYLEKFGNKLILNTWTWLKSFVKIKSWARFLFSVYYPYYNLWYFHIYQEWKQAVIKYYQIPKKVKHKFTFLEKIVILWKKPKIKQKIPLTTKINLD